jgi:Amt family ammonium transporter
MMIDTGDSAFILICSCLVFIMTPGLALFYGGLGRRKNMVSNMMNSFFIMGICMVLYALIGFSLSFGSAGMIIGNLSHIAFKGININDVYSANIKIPTLLFALFQMMFALITPAIITGSIAGRMRFKALFIFIIFWSVLVYYPLAHMVWGGGLIGGKIGSLDFAGGDVVHISSGCTGLILAIFLGKRRGYTQMAYRPHNLPLILLGTGLLWFGWFGFNAGSALGANGLAVQAFLTTAISAASAMAAWMALDIAQQKKPTMIGACTGVLAGLVGITPAAGFIPVWASFIMGITTAVICHFTIILIKKKLQLDDALDAFGCHGIGGIWGGIMTGVFCNPAVNGGLPGLIYGAGEQFVRQITGIIVTLVFVLIGTLACTGLTRLFTPLRVEKRDELVGLDMSQHGENAYPSFNGLD